MGALLNTKPAQMKVKMMRLSNPKCLMRSIDRADIRGASG
jgi:hypothetical protein